jgi:outer membrane protein OmpA-like peptidoglycan-associated protein
MTAYPWEKATLEGHTDSKGTDAYNMKLSQRRVDAIKNYLVEKFGISEDRLKAVGYGESQPIATNDTDEGRQLNRRVQAVMETYIRK